MGLGSRDGLCTSACEITVVGLRLYSTRERELELKDISDGGDLLGRGLEGERRSIVRFQGSVSRRSTRKKKLM